MYFTNTFHYLKYIYNDASYTNICLYIQFTNWMLLQYAEEKFLTTFFWRSNNHLVLFFIFFKSIAQLTFATGSSPVPQYKAFTTEALTVRISDVYYKRFQYLLKPIAVSGSKIKGRPWFATHAVVGTFQWVEFSELPTISLLII